MIQTTTASVAEHFAKFFFADKYDNFRERVVYGDNDSYFKHLGDDKLILPGIVFTLSQVNLIHGPSRPTRFRRWDNASGTKGTVYNARPALLTYSMAIYCQNAQQHFEYLQKYLEVQSSGAIPVRFWTDSEQAIEVMCSMTNFEDPSLQPAGKKSEDFDNTGLIYEIEGGFSTYTLFLVTQEKRLIRCVKYDHYLVPNEFNPEVYCLGKEELTDTPKYLEKLSTEGFNVGTN